MTAPRFRSGRSWSRCLFPAVLLLGGAGAWAAGPSLSRGTVTPATGAADTAFLFTVLYRNPSGNPPVVAGLVIDGGTPLPMKAGGRNHARGVTFSRSAKLAVGTHRFRFSFLADDVWLRLPTTGDLPGPTVVDVSRIGGKVRLRGGAAVAGVKVKALRNGAEVGSAGTGRDGRYRIAELPQGAYLIVPEKTGYGFLPASRKVSVPPSRDGVDFVAVPKPPPTYAVGGIVRQRGRDALSGVKITLLRDGKVVGIETTAAIAVGRYLFEHLPGARYVARPSRAGYTFEPRQRTVTVPPSRNDVDFVAIPVPEGGLSDGKVEPPSGGYYESFTYSVVYTNSLNQPPESALLIIDDNTDRPQAVTMVKDPIDNDFTDGCQYTYQTGLAPGQHFYRFVFGVSGLTWFWPGPTVTDNAPGPFVFGPYE